MAYWLAEQGLALKRALLVVIPLIIIFFIEHVNVIERKGKNGMVRTKKNVFNALNVIRDFIVNLSGNIAGGALLTNVL
ncbi:hypothetical protein HMPREF1142_1687 [Peptostreptococcaceae bacterium AS15]|nr:hypothetical protein HMPREF1142_1687 [Peptostreptococcaceae bacterium AS15]